MFDGFQILLMVADIFDRLGETLLGLVYHVEYDTGEVFSQTTTVDGIDVTLKYRKRKLVKLDGSIHRYFTGKNNDTLFTYRDLVLSVRKLAELFGFTPMQADLQRIEFGVNIPVEDPDEIIDSAVLFNGYPATKRKQKRWKYYKEWRFTEYTVKLYKKGQDLVRFEIRMFRLRQLEKVQLYTVADLIDFNKFVGCLSYLESCAGLFMFVPAGDNLPEDIQAEWAKFRNDQFWKRFSKTNRYTKTRRKNRVEAIIKQYALMDWAAFLVEGIRDQGSLMISPEDATFSQLGSLGESVAEPEEFCNTLAEETPAPTPRRGRACQRVTGASSYHPHSIFHPARPPPRTPYAT